MAEVYAGTIGGVNFNEYAGSVEINVGKEQTTATRRIQVAWSDVWTLIDKLTARPLSPQTSQTDVMEFPTFPGSWSNGQYFSKLVVEDIRVMPSFQGRQPGIDADSSNSNIASYDKADVMLTYKLYLEPKRLASWTTRTSAVRLKGIYEFDDDSKQAHQDPADPLKYLPNQEVLIPVDANEVNKSQGDSYRKIVDLSIANKIVGFINDDKVTIYFGLEKKVFPRRTLLFSSFEVVNTPRYNRASHQILYRFIVAPAYLAEPTRFPENGNEATQNAWRYAYSEEDEEYVYMNKSPFRDTSFNNLFPWSVGGE